jgi:hypothetical protein
MLMCCRFFSDYSLSLAEEVQEQFRISNSLPHFQREKVLWFSKTPNKEKQVNMAFHLALYTRGPVASLFL